MLGGKPKWANPSRTGWVFASFMTPLMTSRRTGTALMTRPDQSIFLDTGGMGVTGFTGAMLQGRRVARNYFGPLSTKWARRSRLWVQPAFMPLMCWSACGVFLVTRAFRVSLVLP